MKTISAYANYGVLAHEKQIIFTVSAPHPHADVSDRIIVTIPDGWGVADNDMWGKLIITPKGATYTADEIISSYGDNPVLSWYDGAHSHRVTLDWENV